MRAEVIRVAVVDDHTIVREGVSRLIDLAPDLEVVASLPDGAAAAEVIRRQDVDVTLMDLSMNGIDGIEATRRIVAADPDARVIILAASADRRAVLAAFDAGAIGFLLKDARPDSLRDSIRAAARGGSPIDPAFARMLLNDRQDRASGIRLSGRGITILQLVADGLSNKQIARSLGIAEKTVKAHLTHVFERLGVTRRDDAVRVALALGIIDQRNEH